MSRFSPGDTLGTCKIEAFVAEGGMAMVYRAQQTLMKRTVAVKVLKPKLLKNKRALASFLKEGMAGARLTHPSIAQVFYTAEENGAYYMVMEFVEGRDLRTILQDRGPFSVRRSLEIVRKVADVLAFSHERGIIHRDIKPGNIMVSPNGEVVLTDFGIASLLSEGSTGEETAGTPSYMSPEQFRAERVDGRSDLYSLGATLFALITGHPPFKKSKTTSLTTQVLESPPPSIRKVCDDVPRAVDQLIMKLLRKSPDERFQTARDVTILIDDMFAERELLGATHRVSPISITQDRTWWPWIIAGAATFIIGFCVYAALMLSNNSSSEALSSADPASEDENPKSFGAPNLVKGIEAFKSALETGRMEEILQLVERSQRNSPKILNSVMSMIQVTNSLPAQSETSHALISESSSTGRAVVMFGRLGTGPSLRVPLRWLKSRDNRWLLRPDPSLGFRYQYQR